MLALILISRPKFLFLDEPFGDLDPVTLRDVTNALKTISKDYGITIVMVSHNTDFIKELSDGSLPVDRFSRYLAQDEVYLSNYYRQMFELAELMDSESNKALFTAFAQSGMEGEQAMHQMLIEKYDIATDVKASVITKAYNELTQSGIDCGNRCIALAGMLPCMWIYNRVGLHIFSNARLEGNPYKEWILEYGNQEFTEGVDTVLDIIDNWAITASEETIAKMDEYYLRAALYEYAFWDYGYHGDDRNYDYAEALEEWI